MLIRKLTLKNYRSYKDDTLVFDDKLNILVGDNAQGKTNVIEAIFFLVIGKSFRTNKEKEVITFGQDGGYIKGEFSRKFRDVEIEMFFDISHKKTIKIDKIPIKRIGELLGFANAVFFSPEELKLVKDSPQERRRFMDIDISQTSKRYFYLIGRYDKVLANRNKLLKSSQNIEEIKETIDIWDRALADLAEKIFSERKNFIEKLSPYAALAHEYITGGKEKLELKYISTFDENYKENMIKALQKDLDKDFKNGFTGKGIHRDDIDIYLNGVEVKNFGSQGQQRTAALSLKLAELEIIKSRTGEYPILLLDDVLSELDAFRRKRLLKFTSKTQTIITCTEFNENIEGKIINIKKKI